MTIKRTTIILLTILAVFTSCENVWMDKAPSNNKVDMFNTLWQEISDHYVFFDQKEVNWDEVAVKYRPMIDSQMSEEEYFELLSEVLSHLKDGHVSLFSGFNTWNYYDLFLNYSSNFNWSFVQRNYLAVINQIGPFIYGKLEGDIGYIYYKSFGDDFTDQELDYLLNNYFKDTRGLIIDVRDNLGGAADNISQLMSLFVEEDIVAGITISPDSDGNPLVENVNIHKHNDFSSYAKPIAILTNRSCYSSCNIFVGFMSQLNHVTIVGDTTGGGSGLAVASELSNGWKFRYSAAKITLADSTEIENGVAPDIVSSTGPEDELSGIDRLIEDAVKLF